MVQRWQGFQEKQKRNFDRGHQAEPLPDYLPCGTNVWITEDGATKEGVAETCPLAPKSYIVTTNGGTICRNRSHLNITPNSAEISSDQQIFGIHYHHINSPTHHDPFKVTKCDCPSWKILQRPGEGCGVTIAWSIIFVDYFHVHSRTLL